jgi:hypothetical protein
MKKYLALSTLFVLLATSSCGQRMFGVDEATWNTLSEQEREKVIDGYNQRKELALINEQKEREKELENERHRQEVEAQTAPFYAAADAISSICEKTHKEPKASKYADRIQAVSNKIGDHVVTIGDTKFEVSPFTKMSDAWIKGQKVQVLKNDKEIFYSVKIKNLDNGETVSARKYH